MSAEQGSSSVPGPVTDALNVIEKIIEELNKANLDKTERRIMFNQIASGCLAVHTYCEAIKKGGQASAQSILNRVNFDLVSDVFSPLNTIQDAGLNSQNVIYVINRLIPLAQQGKD